MRRFLVCLWALVFACSAPGPSEVVETTLPPTTTTVPPAGPEEALERIRACLGEAGFPTELTVGEDGQPDFSALVGEATIEPGFRRALTQCAAPLLVFLELEHAPGLLALIEAQFLRFAECMRSSGVEDFPNPDPGFDGSVPPFPSEQIPRTDPEFAAAVEACAAALGVSTE